MTSSDDLPQAGPRPMVRIARLSLTLLMIIVIAAVAAGLTAGHLSQTDRLWSPTFLAVLALLAISAVALLIPVFRDFRALYAEMQHLPKRERASLQFLMLALLLGLVGGAVGGISSVVGDWFIGENRNLPPALAIGMTVLMVTLAPYLTWRWWRAIDEHEQAAYAEGANIAGHFVLSIGIAWWVLSRAGLLPDPDAMALLIAMSFVWAGVWLYRKFT